MNYMLRRAGLYCLSADCTDSLNHFETFTTAEVKVIQEWAANFGKRYQYYKIQLIQVV